MEKCLLVAANDWKYRLFTAVKVEIMGRS